MEPLSTTASFLAILEATICVGKATAEFCHDFREASRELSQLSTRVLQTQSRLKIQLQLHETLSSGNLDALLPAEALKTLETDLNDVKTCLGVIQGSVPAGAGQPNAHQRLGWVLHEKRKVKKLLRNLRDIDGNLSAMLVTLSLAVSLRSNELIESLNANQSSLINQLKSRSRARYANQVCLTDESTQKGLPLGQEQLVATATNTASNSAMTRSNTHAKSPLQQACRWGFLEIARLLLSRGAFLEHTDSCGRTAFTVLWFQLSQPFCRLEFLEFLFAYSPLRSVINPSEGLSPLACAAIKGDAKDVEFLIKSGADLKQDDTAGDRTIKYSILGCNPFTYDFLEPFMPRGWVFEVDHRGRGPLHIALENATFPAENIVERLVKAGADVHLKDVDGNDPRDTARICDATMEEFGLSEPGSSRNVHAFFDALISSGFDVGLDDDGELWWPSEDRGRQPS
ncbi:MAG: hypothetical protein Q9181_003872 [Wetmoreana brouardii]